MDPASFLAAGVVAAKRRETALDQAETRRARAIERAEAAYRRAIAAADARCERDKAAARTAYTDAERAAVDALFSAGFTLADVRAVEDAATHA